MKDPFVLLNCTWVGNYLQQAIFCLLVYRILDATILLHLQHQFIYIIRSRKTVIVTGFFYSNNWLITLKQIFLTKAWMKKGKQLEWQGVFRSCLCQKHRGLKEHIAITHVLYRLLWSKTEQHNHSSVTKYSPTGWEPAHAHGSCVPSKQQIDKSRLFSSY